jgi:dolichol-phosphate mannosyltransferase
MAKKNKWIKVISFSTNFGHEAAMIAGIDFSSGDAVICLDSDLQHPPEKIPDMIKKYEEGFDVVKMVRINNEEVGVIRNLSSTVFYYLINRVTTTHFEPNASDFFLISKKIADVLKTEFRERNRFLRGFTQLIGFRSSTLEFNAKKRAMGKSKYSYKKLIILSLTAFIAFSNFPLHISLLFGFIVGTVSLIIGIYSIIMKATGNVIPGYTTLVVLVSFMFSIQFILIGIIGEYISFMFTESKKRPIYLVKDVINFKTSRV